MTIFWFVAAAFLAGTLLLLLPPLLRPRMVPVAPGAINAALHREQLDEIEADLSAGRISREQFLAARDEVRRRVLEDVHAGEHGSDAVPARRTALVIALALPLASVLGYLALGNPASLASSAPQSVRGAIPAPPGPAATPARMQQEASALADHVRAQPTDAQAWLQLARNYVALGRYSDGAVALRRLSELRPDRADVFADLADVTAMVQGKRLAGEPARLVQRALDLDPKHPKALALAGSVAFEAREYGAARGYWERLLPLLPPQSPMERSIRGSIAQAQVLEGEAAPAAAAPGAPAASVASAGARLAGRIQISPALASRIAPGDTLFVFARAAQGPRMPLAIVRRDASLPLDFVLDDSMAMSPQFRLSAFDRVIVGARVSRSGSATPQAGDLVGQSAAMPPNSAGVSVTIDHVQP